MSDTGRSRRTARGRRRSGSTTSSATSSARRAVARRRRRSTGSRPARPRAAGASSSGSGADGSIADLTPPPFNVRTRVHEYGGGSYVGRGRHGRLLQLRRRPPVPAGPGRRARPFRSRPTGPWRYADLRVDPRAAPVRSPSARTTPAAARRRLARSSPSRSTATASPERPGRAGRTSWPRRACRPDGTRLAWLEWDHPDMPWDGVPPAHRADRRRRHARGAGPGRRRPGGVDRPARVVARRRPPLRLATARGWWNLYRLLDGPAPRAARADGRRVRRPGLDLRAVVVRVPARRLDRGGRPVRRARSPLPRPARTSSSARSRSPFTEFEGLCVAPGGVVAVAGSPAEPTVVARLRSGDAGRRRRPAPGERHRARSGRRVASPEPIHFPTTDGRTAHALYYPPREPAASSAPDGERPPLVVLSHGGPTVERLDRARPRQRSS